MVNGEKWIDDVCLENTKARGPESNYINNDIYFPTEEVPHIMAISTSIWSV